MHASGRVRPLTSKGIMLLTVLILRSLFNGLFSGLDTQAEISEPLEELYYDGLR